MKRIVERITEKVKSLYKPKKIILFGSYAWGKPTRHSDVDLLIVKETRKRHRDRMLTVRRILGEENASVGMDILVYTPQEIKKRLEINDSFISMIFRRGKILYG